MAAGVLEQEEKAIQHFLREVNPSQEKKQKPVVSWRNGCKFLMARKFDVKRAVELFISHETTREKEDLVAIDPNDPDLKKELITAKLTVLPGRDRTGAAVALFSARLHLPPHATHQVVLKSLIYQLDAALESIETQRQGLVFIYDMTESKYVNFDYDLSIKILNLLKGGYPARLKRVLVVTAPLWFKAPFRFLRLFLKEKLRDRVYTVSVSELVTYIPRSSLPNSLGGDQPSCHAKWLDLCHSCANNQQPDTAAYFSSLPPHSPDPALTHDSPSNTPSPGHTDHISDFDSESSKDTVSEKHTTEDREKEKEDMEEDNRLIESESPTKEKDGQKSSNRKRKTSESRNISPASSPTKQSTDEMPRKKRSPSSGSNILDVSIHMPDAEGQTVEQLLAKVKQMKRRGLVAEYAGIKMEAPTGTFTQAKLKVNLPKNRYTDVLCYDHSRVSLPQDDGETDYINANYVDGYMQKAAFISTQGPVPKTFVDFWRMVWNNQTRVIVMTTKCMERSRTKCGQYWPGEEEETGEFGEMIVYNTSTTRGDDFVETCLMLHNTETGESRPISHLQFTSWPDYGVPPQAEHFLDFLFRVRSVQQTATAAMMDGEWAGHPRGPPIIVHCSAGIGRTGTFITVDVSLRRLDDVGTVDVKETVRRIRSQRAFSIQMPEQYVFCHLAVIEQASRQGLVKSLDILSLDDHDSD